MDSQAFNPALALSRFGLGASSDGIAAIDDVHAGLLQEIADGAPRLQNLPDTPHLIAALGNYREATKMAGNMQKIADPFRAIFLAEIGARFSNSVRDSKLGFNERMVQFWANHFAISRDKQTEVAIICGSFEREAIRPHIFGKFHSLLMAVETHPAMLFYLDNVNSIGLQSPEGLRRGPKIGLNENLAREIMELHTLGVGTGYTQTDVTTFAKVLTGWSVINPRERDGLPGEFIFRDYAHEPGPQTILGKVYKQPGMDQGKAVLRDLAHHPATAQHIAFKLARHFVADDPPPTLVARLSETFIRTNGDLAEVSRTLIEAPESWSPQLVKIRSPLEYCCALIRATGYVPPPQTIASALNAMGQPLWNPPGPNGFPDTAAAWVSPEGRAARMDVAYDLARRLAQTDPRSFAQSRLGNLLSPATAQAVARAETQSQGLALLFMSPEFMRR